MQRKEELKQRAGIEKQKDQKQRINVEKGKVEKYRKIETEREGDNEEALEIGK